MKCDRLLLLGLLGLGLACNSDKGDTTESETSDATTEPGTTGPTTTETDETTTTGPGTTESPTTTSTTTSTTDETTTDGTTGGGFPDELAMGCGFTRPCDDVLLLCGNDQWSPECTEAYTAATQCALEKLVAGERFPLRYDVNGFNGEVEWYDLVFDGEGGALRQNWLENRTPSKRPRRAGRALRPQAGRLLRRLPDRRRRRSRARRVHAVVGVVRELRGGGRADVSDSLRRTGHVQEDMSHGPCDHWQVIEVIWAPSLHCQ
ncbi:hypothetical protein [Nannocystis pusilla]|uniref:hypothetical protein n=1 Tax=Nannocystis pusilla TaxID=889268 RepID=UPI003B7FDA53